MVFLKRIYYVRGEFKIPKAYQNLKEQIAQAQKEHNAHATISITWQWRRGFWGRSSRTWGGRLGRRNQIGNAAGDHEKPSDATRFGARAQPQKSSKSSMSVRSIGSTLPRQKTVQKHHMFRLERHLRTDLETAVTSTTSNHGR